MNSTVDNYLGWKAEKLSPADFWALASNKERYKYLASLSHLAANSHNSQPWAFHYNSQNNSLEFLIQTSRVLPQSDVMGRQAVISLGCALANFEVAAEYFGCKVQKARPSQSMPPKDNTSGAHRPKLAVAAN